MTSPRGCGGLMIAVTIGALVWAGLVLVLVGVLH